LTGGGGKEKEEKGEEKRRRKKKKKKKKKKEEGKRRRKKKKGKQGGQKRERAKARKESVYRIREATHCGTAPTISPWYSLVQVPLKRTIPFASVLRRNPPKTEANGSVRLSGTSPLPWPLSGITGVHASSRGKTPACGRQSEKLVRERAPERHLPAPGRSPGSPVCTQARGKHPTMVNRIEKCIARGGQRIAY
jgi:hypothetical protein